MSEIQPTRLIKAATTFNVGKDHIVEFLQKKGFTVDNKPTFMLTEEMMRACFKEYRGELHLKEEAEQISLGLKGKETLIAKSEFSEPVVEEKPRKKKVEEPPAVEHVEVKKVELDKPKVVTKIDLDAPKKKAAAAAEVPKETPLEVEAPKKAASKEKVVEEVQKPLEEKPAEVIPEHIETKRVELSGTKILGTIDLSKFNEKPKAKTAEENKAEAEKRQRKRIKKGTKVDTERVIRETRTGDGKKSSTDEPQLVSQQELQQKIKETLNRITGGGKPNTRQKLRRDKRDRHAEVAEQAMLDKAESDKKLKVTEFITVAQLASMMDKKPIDIISALMKVGMMVSINQRLEADSIDLIASEFGYEVEFISAQQEDETEVEIEDDPAMLVERAPIVTIMGHVDHGKTSLLDYIRKANVAGKEAGGITQHIGAYEVVRDGRPITFLDTPGHEAFTAMRARGARLTDVAVIVIAADDSIMPQTREAISHAQSAGVPMIFAINKIDKPGANADAIKAQLAQMNLQVEEWGGKYQSQDLSAKTGLGVPELLDKILVEAEIKELKANPDRTANGSVIEASLDKGRGYVATMLVQNGTLRVGDMIVTGPYFGKIKAMFNHLGENVKEAGPSMPVQILGLQGAPQAGEKFKSYDNEQEAKQAANKRAQIEREQAQRTRKHITLDEIGRRLSLGSFKELNIIVKGDVDGSVEALSDSLLKLSTEEVAVRILHKAVGQITESDVLLASASDAIIIGFNVRPSLQAKKLADTEDIEIRHYSIIYKAIEEIKSAMEGMLSPEKVERVTGMLEVKEVFKITKVGTIAGCIVVDGKVKRDNKLRLLRDGIVVYTGALGSLKRFKDDAKEVVSGQDCGIGFKDYNDIRNGDMIESFEEVEVQRRL